MNDRIVTVGVQVLPLCEDPYPVVDRAIAAIRATGIKHQVCPMETVLEGTLEACLAAARAAHDACFEGGVKRALTIIKISDGLDGSTIEDKMEKYR
ncbi:MAG: thiamine-binding protein [Anaerolinea sp.]|nr:thiamine-binding protein [Anaerolinea sp.]MCC6976250.1 thiamine-binding protein [Anaerolineae bacterium]CAG0955467.1 hypothetical protein ANRL4_00343 [Anaerolineae bacterium]